MKRGEKIVREYVKHRRGDAYDLLFRKSVLKKKQEMLQLGWTDKFQIEIERILK